MRSSNPRTVEVYKTVSAGCMPPMLGLFHRHFQKSLPTTGEKEATIVAPVDLLDLLVPPEILNGIESIEIVYKKD